MKHPTLPRRYHIQLNGRYKDIKTNRWVDTSKLGSLCPQQPITPLISELKQEIIQSSRWDLKYD